MSEAITTPLVLPARRDLYYGGAWHEPKLGVFIDKRSPSTGQPLGRVAEAGSGDVDAAVTAAHRAFGPWQGVPPAERARLLRRMADVLRRHAEELALLEAHDCG